MTHVQRLEQDHPLIAFCAGALVSCLVMLPIAAVMASRGK